MMHAQNKYLLSLLISNLLSLSTIWIQMSKWWRWQKNCQQGLLDLTHLNSQSNQSKSYWPLLAKNGPCFAKNDHACQKDCMLNTVCQILLYTNIGCYLKLAYATWNWPCITGFSKRPATKDLLQVYKWWLLEPCSTDQDWQISNCTDMTRQQLTCSQKQLSCWWGEEGNKSQKEVGYTRVYNCSSRHFGKIQYPSDQFDGWLCRFVDIWTCWKCVGE